VNTAPLNDPEILQDLKVLHIVQLFVLGDVKRITLFYPPFARIMVQEVIGAYQTTLLF
jgi:hypothetical protein